ncbi:MAG: DMT family transporter [Beijerinckiaceae bacterium]
MCFGIVERVKPLRYTSPPATPPVPVHREERPLLGIGLNALSFVAIACADTLSKLAVAVMPAPQIILIRAIMILALLTPMFWQATRKNDPPWRTQQVGRHLIRAALQILAMVAFLIAVRNMPLTTVVSIQFISPLLVAIFAALLLKEKMSWAQIGPILLGFAGCMIILQPGTEGFSYFSIIAIICAVSWSLVLVLLRGLTATDSASTILFWQNAMQVVAMIFVAPFFWVAVTGDMLWILLGLALMQSLGQWLSTKAMSFARAAVIAPLHYTQLIWITLLGWLVFNEWPGPHVWIGAAIIILSGLWLMRAQSGTIR